MTIPTNSENFASKEQEYVQQKPNHGVEQMTAQPTADSLSTDPFKSIHSEAPAVGQTTQGGTSNRLFGDVETGISTQDPYDTIDLESKHTGKQQQQDYDDGKYNATNPQGYSQNPGSNATSFQRNKPSHKQQQTYDYDDGTYNQTGAQGYAKNPGSNIDAGDGQYSRPPQYNDPNQVSDTNQTKTQKFSTALDDTHNGNDSSTDDNGLNSYNDSDENYNRVRRRNQRRRLGGAGVICAFLAVWFIFSGGRGYYNASPEEDMPQDADP